MLWCTIIFSSHHTSASLWRRMSPILLFGLFCFYDQGLCVINVQIKWEYLNLRLWIETWESWLLRIWWEPCREKSGAAQRGLSQADSWLSTSLLSVCSLDNVFIPGDRIQPEGPNTTHNLMKILLPAQALEILQTALILIYSLFLFLQIQAQERRLRYQTIISWYIIGLFHLDL